VKFITTFSSDMKIKINKLFVLALKIIYDQLFLFFWKHKTKYITIKKKLFFNINWLLYLRKYYQGNIELKVHYLYSLTF